MTKNKTQYNANVKYVAYIMNEYDGAPVHALASRNIKHLLNDIERHMPGQEVERKPFSLLHSAFHDAPVFMGLVGPVYSESPDREEVCLNYIQNEVLGAFDNDHGPLLQVHSEVEDLIRPLIKGRSKSNYDHYRPRQ